MAKVLHTRFLHCSINATLLANHSSYNACIMILLKHNVVHTFAFHWSIMMAHFWQINLPNFLHSGCMYCKGTFCTLHCVMMYWKWSVLTKKSHWLGVHCDGMISRLCVILSIAVVYASSPIIWTKANSLVLL